MSRRKKTPVDFSELGGFRFLHFGTEWIQGGMRINRPYQLALDYQQSMMALMLFVPEPKEILQLGLGAGGLAKYTWKYFPEAKTRVVEIAEEVYMASRMWFKMPDDDDHLETIFEDCKKYLVGAQKSADWLLTDIYDAEAWGPVYNDVPFYRLCRKGLRDGGVSSYNVFGGEDFTKSLDAISEAFNGHVLVMPEVAEGNRIILAKNGPKETYPAELLDQRAAELTASRKIPAKKLLKMLRKENNCKGDIVF